jgi:hypothetical protein
VPVHPEEIDETGLAAAKAGALHVRDTSRARPEHSHSHERSCFSLFLGCNSLFRCAGNLHPKCLCLLPFENLTAPFSRRFPAIFPVKQGISAAETGSIVTATTTTHCAGTACFGVARRTLVFSGRSSAPARCRHRLPVGRVAAIERLRRERLTGPAIARALGLARSTVGAVLRRLGLGRLSALEPTPPAIRYERERPGELGSPPKEHRLLAPVGLDHLEEQP